MRVRWLFFFLLFFFVRLYLYILVLGVYFSAQECSGAPVLIKCVSMDVFRYDGAIKLLRGMCVCVCAHRLPPQVANPRERIYISPSCTIILICILQFLFSIFFCSVFVSAFSYRILSPTAESSLHIIRINRVY